MENNIPTRFISTVIILVCFFDTFGQSKRIDKLEQYYDQGHYKMVFRKSVRLINNQNITILCCLLLRGYELISFDE